MAKSNGAGKPTGKKNGENDRAAAESQEIENRDEALGDAVDHAGGGDRPEVEAGARRETAAVATDEAPAAKPEFVTDPRERIGAAFKFPGAVKAGEEDDEGDDEEATERRAAEDAESSTVPPRVVPAPTIRSNDDVVDEEEEGETAPAAGERRAPAALRAGDVDLTGDEIVELVVNGQRVELPLREVIGTAQKNLAGDDYLARAKRTLAEANNARREPPAEDDRRQRQPTDRRQPTEQPDRRDPDRAPPARDRARLVDAIDKIQTGSPEEAADELARLLDEEADRRGNTSLSEPELVNRVRSDIRIETEAESALTQFSQKYGEDFKKHRRLQDAVIRETAEEMVSDLRAAGVPDDEILEVQNNPAAVLDAHNRLRFNPKFNGAPWRSELRSYPDILMSAAETVHKTYIAPLNGGGGGDPPPRTETPRMRLREGGGTEQRENGARPPPGRIRISTSRVELKNGLPLQPRSASTRSDMRATNQPKKRDDSGYIASMRKERGQSA